MSDLYVAMSKGLQSWAGDVGLTKHVYKLGVAPDDADAAVTLLNERRFGGRADWKLVRKHAVEQLAEGEAVARVSGKEMVVDPTYYPQIKGATGLLKVKIPNVENHVLMRQALAGEQPKNIRIKPTDVADYLIRNVIS